MSATFTLRQRKLAATDELKALFDENGLDFTGKLRGLWNQVKKALRSIAANCTQAFLNCYSEFAAVLRDHCARLFGQITGWAMCAKILFLLVLISVKFFFYESYAIANLIWGYITSPF